MTTTGGKQTHLRADVESTALPVGLGGQVRRELGVVVERHVLDDERTFLAHCVDAQRARNRRLCAVTTYFKRCNGVECTEIAYLGNGERAAERV